MKNHEIKNKNDLKQNYLEICDIINKNQFKNWNLQTFESFCSRTGCKDCRNLKLKKPTCPLYDKYSEGVNTDYYCKYKNLLLYIMKANSVSYNEDFYENKVKEIQTELNLYAFQLEEEIRKMEKEDLYNITFSEEELNILNYLKNFFPYKIYSIMKVPSVWENEALLGVYYEMPSDNEHTYYTDLIIKKERFPNLKYEVKYKWENVLGCIENSENKNE